MVILKNIFLVVLMVMVCKTSKAIVNPYYKADCMDHGCTTEDLNKEMRKLNSRLYQMVSWDIKDENIEKVCQTLLQLHLTIINLQGVSKMQLDQLSETCLQDFKASGIPKSESDSTLLNPIFHRDQSKVIKEGTTNAKHSKCPSMAWAKISLNSSPHSQQPRLVRRSFSANLFAILSSNKTVYRKISSRSPRMHHFRKVHFVNVRLSETDDAEMMKECLYAVHHEVNGHRRYRTVFSGNFQSKEKIAVLDYPTRRRHKIFKHCAVEHSSKGGNKICIANRGRRDTFQFALTAVLQTNCVRNPTFVAFSV